MTLSSFHPHWLFKRGNRDKSYQSIELVFWLFILNFLDKCTWIQYGMFLISFAQAALLDLLILTTGVSISFRQISRFGVPPPFFFKCSKGLLLETHSVFGLVNVDGVFLSNHLVDGRMTLLFLATFFERAICLCWRWQIRTLPSFCFPKRTNSLTVFMVIILSALVCLWGLFNDDHIKLFWEFSKPFPLLSMNSVSWLTTLPT